MKVTAKTTVFRPIWFFHTRHLMYIPPLCFLLDLLWRPWGHPAQHWWYPLWRWQAASPYSHEAQSLWDRHRTAHQLLPQNPEDSLEATQRLFNPFSLAHYQNQFLQTPPAHHVFILCPEHDAHKKAFPYHTSIFKNWLNHWHSTHLKISDQVRNPAAIWIQMKTSYPDRYWGSLLLLVSAALMLTASGICALAAL